MNLMVFFIIYLLVLLMSYVLLEDINKIIEYYAIFKTLEYVSFEPFKKLAKN